MHGANLNQNSPRYSHNNVIKKQSSTKKRKLRWLSTILHIKLQNIERFAWWVFFRKGAVESRASWVYTQIHLNIFHVQFWKDLEWKLCISRLRFKYLFFWSLASYIWNVDKVVFCYSLPLTFTIHFK